MIKSSNMNQSVESAPPVDDIIEIIPMDEYDSNKVPLIDLLMNNC